MRTNQTLAKMSATEAREFLVRFANLLDEPAAVKDFQEKFAELLPEESNAFVFGETTSGGRVGPSSPLPTTLGKLRELLRAIWREPDARTRDWGLLRLLHYYMIGRNVSLGAVPEWINVKVAPPTNFERCVVHFARLADRARYCGNAECSAPYFFATHRGQKYCSDECALPAQREFKRKWWDEHGKDWRKSHQRKRKARGSHSKRQ